MIAPLVGLLALAWVALLVAAPLLPAAAAGITYALSSLVCHQLSDRSFHLAAAQLPVCARCLGIYAGFACGAAFAMISGAGAIRFAGPGAQARRLVALGAAPTAVTVLAEWAGVWQTSNVARALAGAPLGATVAVVVIAALATLHYGECARRPPITSHRPPSPI